jgi:hypothetical protein
MTMKHIEVSVNAATPKPAILARPDFMCMTYLLIVRFLESRAVS